MGLDTTVLCSLPIHACHRILQQSSKCYSPTGLGLHIKWLGNMNPRLREAKPHQGAQAAQHFTR